jgi:hypothetical protein
VLIVTQRLTLEAQYATSGYSEIRATLAKLPRQQDRVLVVDDPLEMQAWGLDPVSSADGIKATLRYLGATYPSVVDSVFIIGGSGIVPFFSLANPVTNRGVDGDELVLTDNPYGSAADALQEYLAPSVPVGRLPVPDDAGLDDFVAAIERVIDPPAKTGQPGAALFVNDDWLAYSQRVATALPDPRTWHVSPGYLMDASSVSAAGYQTLYFNLHGFSSDADWSGYSTAQRKFVPAVEPQDLETSFVAGSLAFAECCYGAQIAGRSPQDSCALKLLQAGATFIGATGIAFGSYVASDFLLQDADFLVRAFFQAVQRGYPVGSALMVARKAYLSDSSENQQGQNWQCKQKTLLQFVLYGNPALVH